jgi:hypothetical protein
VDGQDYPPQALPFGEVPLVLVPHPMTATSEFPAKLLEYQPTTSIPAAESAANSLADRNLKGN